MKGWVRRSGPWFLGATLLVLSGAAASQEAAGEAKPDTQPEAVTIETLEAARAALAREIEALGSAEAPSAAERSQWLELVEELDRVLARHQKTLRRAETLASEAGAAPLPEAIASVLAEPPPYSIHAFDSILDDLDSATLRRERAEASAQAAEDELIEARKAFESAESARRRAREEADTAAPQARPSLLAALRSRELESRVAAAALALRRDRRSNARRALELAGRQQAELETAVARVQGQLLADEAERAERQAELEKRRFDLERSLAAARIDLENAERRFRAVQTRLDAQPAPAAELREEGAALRAELAAAQRAVALGEEQLARLERIAGLWDRRYQLAGGTAPDDALDAWLEEAQSHLDAARRRIRLDESRISELRDEVAATREEMVGASGAEARWIERRADSLGALIALYEHDLETLAEERRLAERLSDALAHERETLSLRERLAQLRSRAGEIWDYEVTSSADRPITVGKLVTALLVFVLGWLAARLVAAGLGRRVLPRLRFDPGASRAFESLAFYFLLVIVFLTTLRTVNIPLTAFAVVGGALAIGVGFGSQNVVSNFISGLILLAERPLKVGDLVDVDGTYGVIEHIGLRSTRVRSGDNVHIIVPNASFLENKVINWTHNDPKVRVNVTVGVAYGSPTREVERLLLKAIAEHPRVLGHPEPVVLFTAFGDNSLNFEARFWIQMKTVMERLRIESDLRYRIDDLFRESDVVIAFPQRDVHLDTPEPLQVRVVADESERGGS